MFAELSVVGVGIDICGISRFADNPRLLALVRQIFTPREAYLGLAESKWAEFSDAENPTNSPKLRPAQSLAGKFAAKEAVLKALGCPLGLTWQDLEILNAENGQPYPLLQQSFAAAAQELAITDWRLSISHDAGIAIAIAIALKTD